LFNWFNDIIFYVGDSQQEKKKTLKSPIIRRSNIPKWSDQI